MWTDPTERQSMMQRRVENPWLPHFGKTFKNMNRAYEFHTEGFGWNSPVSLCVNLTLKSTDGVTVGNPGLPD